MPESKPKKPTPRKYPPELRERAVRLVREAHQGSRNARPGTGFPAVSGVTRFRAANAGNAAAGLARRGLWTRSAALSSAVFVFAIACGVLLVVREDLSDEILCSQLFRLRAQPQVDDPALRVHITASRRLLLMERE